MDIGEDVLTSEVAKLRKKNLYETKKTEKEQPAEEVVTTETPHTPALPSFVENIFCREEEREIIYSLLKYGSEKIFDTTVATYIIQEIVNDDLQLQNLEYRKIFEEYSALLEERKVVDVKHFINHPDQKVCELTIDLLSPKYTPSKIWQHHGSIITDKERLQMDIPKVITVYKAKVLTQAIARTHTEMANKNGEELDELMLRLRQLNSFRTELAKVLDRPVF